MFQNIGKIKYKVKDNISEIDIKDLNNGINNSVEIVSKVDGYLQSPEIKIPFPPDAKKIEDRLRSLGLNKLVDDAILFINRAAEDAATEAKPKGILTKPEPTPAAIETARLVSLSCSCWIILFGS